MQCSKTTTISNGLSQYEPLGMGVNLFFFHIFLLEETSREIPARPVFRRCTRPMSCASLPRWDSFDDLKMVSDGLGYQQNQR